MNPSIMHRIGATIGQRRRRTCDRGSGAVVWTGLLGHGETVWTGLLGLCIRLQAVVTVSDMHEAIRSAFPDCYESEYVAGQLAYTEMKMLRGDHVPGWFDLVQLVPDLERFEEEVFIMLSEATNG